jgi:hypothetical protein
MNRFVPLALCAAIFSTAGSAAAAAPPPATATPAATATPSPAPSADPAITARAKSFYHSLATGMLDRSQLSAPANAKMTDQTVKDVAAKLAPMGEPVTFEYVKSGHQSGSTLYAYLLGFGNGQKLEFVLGIDAQGKVSALALQPAQ